MIRFRSASGHTSWDGTTAPGKSSGGQLHRSAVEKAGAWKPAKTKGRFSPAPTLPWKSRKKREIPTFPPRRLRLVFFLREQRKPKPKPAKRRPDGRFAF